MACRKMAIGLVTKELKMDRQVASRWIDYATYHVTLSNNERAKAKLGLEVSRRAGLP